MLMLSKVMWSGKMVDVFTVLWSFVCGRRVNPRARRQILGAFQTALRTCSGCFCKGCWKRHQNILYTALRCWWQTSKYVAMFAMFAAIWHSETRRKGLLLVYISVYSKCCKTLQLTWEMKVGVGYACTKFPMRGWNCSYDIWTTNRIKEVVQHPKLFLFLKEWPYPQQ